MVQKAEMLEPSATIGRKEMSVRYHNFLAGVKHELSKRATV